MKRFYNKALIYQSLYSGKWGILAGIIFLVYFSYGELERSMNIVKNDISFLQSNELFIDAFKLLCLVLFFLGVVYILITGFNKRNNLTFLTCGPYSKEEIKKNEYLFLLGVLLIFIFVVSYSMLCVFIKNRELLSYINLPWEALLFTIFKLLVVGLIFITYLTFMDMFFSNLIISVLTLLSFPFVMFLNLSMIYRFIFLNTTVGENLSYRLFTAYNYVLDFIQECITFINRPFWKNESYNVSTTIIVLAYLVVVGVVYYSRVLLTKRLYINNINRFFVFPFAGRVFVTTGLVTLIVVLTYFVFRYNNDSFLYGINSNIYSMLVILVFVGIIYICDLIGRRLLNRFQAYL